MTPLPFGTTLYVYHGHSAEVFTVRWSPNGKSVASGGLDGTVQVWDAATGVPLFTHPSSTPRDVVRCLAWSPDGKRIAFGIDNLDENSSIKVSDVVYGNDIFTFRDYSSLGRTVLWSPDGTRIVAGADNISSSESVIAIWDSTTGNRVFSFSSHFVIPYPGLGSPLALAWSPDGTHIAASMPDNTVKIWDVTARKLLFTYRVHGVNAVVWSPDSKNIASAGSDKTVQVWEAATGKLFFTYRGHANRVNIVAWSPDGRHIASGSDDKTVQIWEATTGNHALTYRGHMDPVNAVSWSPHGRRIASGGGIYTKQKQNGDYTVQVWQAV